MEVTVITGVMQSGPHWSLLTTSLESRAVAVANHNEASQGLVRERAGAEAAASLWIAPVNTQSYSLLGEDPLLLWGWSRNRTEFFELGPVGTSGGDDLILFTCSWGKKKMKVLSTNAQILRSLKQTVSFRNLLNTASLPHLHQIQWERKDLQITATLIIVANIQHLFTTCQKIYVLTHFILTIPYEIGIIIVLF